MADGLRVTFVAIAYAPSVGGSQLHVQRLAEGLAARGHRVEVLTTDAIGSLGARRPGRIAESEEHLRGVYVRRHRTPELARRAQRLVRTLVARRPWATRSSADVVGPWIAGPLAPSLAWSIARAAWKRDVIVACSAPYLTFVAPPRLRPRRAAVVGMPLLHLARAEPAAGVRRALRRCDELVASTTAERDAMRTVAPSPLPIHVIPPGTDPDDVSSCDAAEARRRLGLPPGPTVGYIGRLAAYKGIDTLLEAAPSLWRERPDLNVVVAGRPSGYDGAQRALARGAGEGHLVVRESFPDDERSLLYAACDVIVLPSRDESFGLGIADAWAASRPIVVADIEAVRSVVRPGIDAEVVPVGDAQALAATVVRLLDEPTRRSELAMRGRARVDEQLSWSVAADRWDQVVRSAARRRGAVA